MDIKNTNSASINISPSFGASASFSSVSDSITFGNNHKQIMLGGINGLSMSLDLQFDELTDNESNNLISFFQSQFRYEIQNYVGGITGMAFDNKRIDPFNYQPFFPYKKNKFNCIEFSHNKTHFNVNNISAKFSAIAPSILNSIESGPNHNENIDAIINANIGSTSSVSNKDVSLPAGSIIYQSGTYSNAIVTSDFNVADGSSASLSASNNFTAGGPESISCNQTPDRHSIYINNPNDCFYYPYPPIHQDGSLSHRMFDFRPSVSISLQHSPKYMKSTVSEVYQKFNKYGFNPNLTNLSLSFNGRSDLEAKRILLFLESHLGYKKFGFHVSRDYGGNQSDTINTSPHRKTMSFFYCPEWKHTFNYKDNHSISASFIECVDY